jgi:hypothetical protein
MKLSSNKKTTNNNSSSSSKKQKLRSVLYNSNDHPNVQRYSKLHISRRSQRKLHKQTL